MSASAPSRPADAAVLQVVHGGLLSTVQDAGRPDSMHLGVPRSGACDPTSLAIANALLGNDPDAAAIEMTLVGPELRVLEACVVAIAGADLGGRIVGGSLRIRPDMAQLLRAGMSVAFRGRAAGETGVRAYLALAGGVDVPVVLGSRSTCLAGAFGGLDGRPLGPGDRIMPLRPGSLAGAGRTWPTVRREAGAGVTPVLHMVPGPHIDRFEPAAADALVDTTWRVGAGSDRMGVRLEGPSLRRTREGSRELTSLPMTWGALQVPADGAPIALLADHQTVGGYPVIGVVIAADRPLLGRLGTGDAVRFAWTSLGEATHAARAAAQDLARAALAVARTDPWDGLSESAEG